MRLVLDASVAIKLDVAEPDSDLAVDWLGREVDFVAPDLLAIEVAQALLRHHREGRLSRPQLTEALADLVSLFEIPVPTADLLDPALEFAQRLTHGLHDCVYLALAARLGCEVLTADEKLALKVRRAPGSPSVRLITEALV